MLPGPKKQVLHWVHLSEFANVVACEQNKLIDGSQPKPQSLFWKCDSLHVADLDFES